MQNGPQMSPAMYEEFFKPRHARMWRRAKELAGVKVMLHCCGGVRPLLGRPDRGRPGRHQPRANHLHGHGDGGLKARFRRPADLLGRRLRHALHALAGHARGIRRHVREQMAILSPGGGFVFQQVHNILADVPPENVIAMLERGAQFNESK